MDIRRLKKRDEIDAAKYQETEAFLRLAAERLAKDGHGNMEWMEFGLRAAMQREARSLLEGLLNDPALAVANDHAMEGERCYRNRAKMIETLFGPVEIGRNYYYGATESEGRFPLDDALGLIEGYSPALARLMRCLEADHGARKRKSRSPTSRKIAPECSMPLSEPPDISLAQALWKPDVEPWSDRDSNNPECFGRAPARRTSWLSAPLS